MKRGPKPQLPEIKRQRGTYRPCRDNGPKIELAAPGDLPQKPNWLTAAGEQVWIDDIGRVASVGLVTELDTTCFGTYCNLQGAAILVWRAGGVPPITALAEIRKLAEIFGIAGARSRIGTSGAGSEAAANPFSRFKRSIERGAQ